MPLLLQSCADVQIRTTTRRHPGISRQHRDGHAPGSLCLGRYILERTVVSRKMPGARTRHWYQGDVQKTFMCTSTITGKSKASHRLRDIHTAAEAHT